MDTRARGRRVCELKTARGNCYLDAQTAEEAAASMSRKTGANIEPYRCLFGAHWHIGRHRTEAELRRLRQENEGASREESP